MRMHHALLAEEALLDHVLPRDDTTILQFCVRVVNYPEQRHFESETLHSQLVDMYWKQGAGINVAVCGYATQATVLLQFKHIVFLEVYELTKDDSYLNERISFGITTNPQNLVAPFVEQLALVEGCHFGTMETLWKFYRAQLAAKQLKLDRLDKRFKSGAATLTADSSFVPETHHPESLLIHIKNDLRDDNVNAFESFASNIYKQSFERHYCRFPT